MADRLILTDKARFVGDAVAAVVAVDLLTAEKALHLIEVEYEVLPFVLTPEDALKEGAPVLHDGAARTTSLSSLRHPATGTSRRSWPAPTGCSRADFETSIVQHCHLEPQTAFAYRDSHGRIVINSSTQIPHIVRRIVAQALGLRWGRVQVIKPYIGGGFGAKQDVVIEPLVAAMTLAVHGRPVRCTFTREEVFIDSRTRHAMKIHLRIAASKDGRLQGIDVKVLSNTGAYASHGHSIAMSTGRQVPAPVLASALQVPSPGPSTPTCRWPGPCAATASPQMFFALESQPGGHRPGAAAGPHRVPRARTSSASGYTGSPHQERGALLRHPRVHRQGQGADPVGREEAGLRRPDRPPAPRPGHGLLQLRLRHPPGRPGAGRGPHRHAPGRLGDPAGGRHRDRPGLATPCSPRSPPRCWASPWTW